jgi:hypothetical protein
VRLRSVRGLAGPFLGAALALASAGPVHAGDAVVLPDSAAYSWTQQRASYTVYEPSVTLGMPGTLFETNGGPGLTPGSVCGGARNPLRDADYGHQGGSGQRYAGLQESASGCLDGPDGVGLVGAFSVGGARATVMGACPDERPVCGQRPRSSVRVSAYTTVTLPGRDGRSSTYVEVYSQGLTWSELKRFVRGLRPVPAP